MDRKIQEISKALDAKLYNCALALTLTLPDICAKVEYRGKDWGNGRKYRSWFDVFAKPMFTFKALVLPTNETVTSNTIDADTCWKIRCAVLHSGNYKPTNTSESRFNHITFHAHDPSSEIWEHEIIDGRRIEIDVIKFCHLLCSAALEYYESVDDKSVFDIDEVTLLDW